MDDVQVLRRTQMRLFKDRLDVLVWGKWYWCPEGAKRVPFPHPFTSSRLLPDGNKHDVTLGEVFGAQDVHNESANPRYTGQNVCGSADVWKNGILYADRGTPAVDFDGVPLCCDAVPAPPGGVMADGDSLQEVLVGFAFDEGYDVGYDAPG
jgi:hypothetical protein